MQRFTIGATVSSAGSGAPNISTVDCRLARRLFSRGQVNHRRLSNVAKAQGLTEATVDDLLDYQWLQFAD
jgi:hypothetical protein